MRAFLLCGLLLLMVFAPDSASSARSRPPGSPFAARWKQIDALLAKGQTATAAPLVEAIYQQARKDQNTPDYLRALLYKVRLLEAKEEDADEKAIALLEKDLRTAAFPARPILHSLLAGLYTDYLNENRYRLYQRTAGAAPTPGGPDGADAGADAGTGLATWDLGRLGAAIVRHYHQSVEDEPRKQLQTSLAQLGSLATGGDAEGRALRPTLYDLLAHRAIAGLQNQELYLTRPEQQFRPTEAPLLGSAGEFAALRLRAPEADSLNGPLHALRVLQRLTTARLALVLPGTTPQSLAALADVDLLRLDYLRGLTQAGELAAAYEPALTRMAETYQALPISTEFMARRAELLRDSTPVAAVALARAAEARFPKSRGAARARQLREQLEGPELAFSAAEVVVPDRPWRLELTRRNVAALYARAYRLTLSEWRGFSRAENQDRPFARRYARALRTAPAATWAVPVPADPAKYREQKLAATGPPLPAGYYLVVISSRAGQPVEPGNGFATAYAAVGVSELSVLRRPNNPENGSPTLLMLSRRSGAPLAGVRAQAMYSQYSRVKSREEPRLGEVLTTTATGELRVPAPRPRTDAEFPERLLRVRAWRGPDTLVTDINSYYHPNQAVEEPARRQTFLFTDRAIYRPGQTLYFKGILTESRQERALPLAGQVVSVRLTDVNGQTVRTLPFTTSDFGSFHGSVVLPTGLLNGEMSLQTDYGSLGFAVEDYKRPTFLVKLDSVSGRPRLGQPVAVPGRALAYAGPAIDGAKVSFRVTRRELWAFFGYGGGYDGGGYGGSRRPGYGGGGSEQEIAHGTTSTDAEGRFVINFTPPLPAAKPSRPGRWEPGYVFEITADVTDAAGETRTGTRSLVIGRNPLSLRLSGPALVDRRRPARFSLSSQNATGEPLAATGTLRLLARPPRPSQPGVPAPAPIDDESSAFDGPEPAPRLVKTLPFDTKNGPALDLTALLADLTPGRYRLEARAAGPDTVRAALNFVLYDPAAATIPYETPDWFVAHADTANPNQSYILLGSRDADARVLLEIERGGRLLRQEWLSLKANEQRRIRLDTGTVAATGPLHVHTTQVRDNQLYTHHEQLEVARPPQPLQISLSTFRDRLLPGQRETWRLTIRRADGKPADAELLATLYDQSLDLFRPHSFAPLATEAPYFPVRFGWQGSFNQRGSEQVAGPGGGNEVGPVEYPQLATWNDYQTRMTVSRRLSGRVAGVSTEKMSAGYNQQQLSEVVVQSTAVAAPMAAMDAAAGGSAKIRVRGMASGQETRPAAAAPDLSTIQARRDFRETALWQPALRTDKNGDLVLEFQMPEAVTRWQLLMLAHDRQLRTGQLARQLVTQKQIQITPNAPRFLRPGDSFTFPAKFSNLTDQPTRGTAQLFLLDAATGQDITGQLLAGSARQAVSAAAHQSAPVSWNLSLPADFAPVAVTYRVVASSELPVAGSRLSAADFSLAKSGKKDKRKARRNSNRPTDNQQLTTITDGEENTLPVLPNRILVTESLPLPIVGPGTRTFELRKLTGPGSPTRRNHSLTLELTPNPGWLAVQSLPYLMEYPYECSEQVFSRLYANLIAAHILKSNPRFRVVLAEWQRLGQSGTAAQKNSLVSKLEQNQELKNLLLQETPWVRDAQNENERLARLVTLFDQPRLAAETARALAQLGRMQLPGGAFPWFERMPADRYLTQLIVAGFGKLRRLGAFDAGQNPVAQGILQNALRYLDAQLADDYAALRRPKTFRPNDNHLTDIAVQALYARSFWPEPSAAKPAQPAYQFFRQQGAAHWGGQARQLQGQLALALNRHYDQVGGVDKNTAALIMRALAENALHSPELGMYWKEVRGGYYWREAPTETQAVLIEAFDEVGNDQKSVDEMKLWLLKQKQVQSWESTRATADACYALLLRGSDFLATKAPLQVQVGAEKVSMTGALAGTGYVKTSWPAAAIQPAQGQITLTKTDPGVAWGALYWQYFEDIDKVTPAASPLAVERQLYRETRTASGPVLTRLTAAAPLRVGEVLVVRLVLRTDRALEYVHLKDQRAAGLELSAPTSGYRYQNGLGYYESPRDAATNFFFGTLPRGTHVFEYRLRAAQAGDFSGGLSQVQCLYAPEFGATSAGGRLRVAP